MGRGRREIWVRLVAAVAVAGAMTVVAGSTPVAAAAPTITAPVRVYGPSTTPGTPVPFTGFDLLGASRDINFPDLTEGANCDPAGNDYFLGDCPFVKVDFQAGSSHGHLALPSITEVTDSQNGTHLIAPGGAVITESGTATTSDPTSLLFNFSGTTAQIDAAYDALTFVPNDGYEYLKSGYEVTLHLRAQNGDAAGESAEKFIEIRILGFNDFPELTVPGGGRSPSPPAWRSPASPTTRPPTT